VSGASPRNSHCGAAAPSPDRHIHRPLKETRGQTANQTAQSSANTRQRPYRLRRAAAKGNAATRNAGTVGAGTMVQRTAWCCPEGPVA